MDEIPFQKIVSADVHARLDGLEDAVARLDSLFPLLQEGGGTPQPCGKDGEFVTEGTGKPQTNQGFRLAIQDAMNNAKDVCDDPECSKLKKVKVLKKRPIPGGWMVEVLWQCVG